MNERGVVLPTAMLMLVVLLALMVAFSALARTEPVIAENQLKTARARALAEAGVERAIWALATAAIPDSLGAQTAGTSADAPYNGVPFITLNSLGGFTVRVQSAGSAASNQRTVEAVGTLYGRVLWGEPGERAGLQLHLIGLPGTSSQDHRYSIRTDDDGRFEFAGIEAGTYKLSDRIAGDPSWRLRIGVEPGRDLSLDLTGDNRLPQRDDFPPVAYPRG